MHILVSSSVDSRAFTQEGTGTGRKRWYDCLNTLAFLYGADAPDDKTFGLMQYITNVHTFTDLCSLFAVDLLERGERKKRVEVVDRWDEVLE